MALATIPLSWLRVLNHLWQSVALTLISLLFLSALVEVWRLSRTDTPREDKIAQGLNELTILENLRSWVRIYLTRNYGLDNLADQHQQQWNMQAQIVEDAIRQPTLNLSFMKEIPSQWRKRIIDDSVLDSAALALDALIAERLPCRDTAFARLHSGPSGR